MAFKNLRREQKDTLKTFPNLLTASRFIGGIALGILMSSGRLDAAKSTALVGILSVTDMEGSLIQFAKKFPWLQKHAHIYASTIGQKADPVADKVFAVSVLAGGVASGDLSLSVVAPILATEMATAGLTIFATQQGHELNASTIGKLGMVGRCMTVGAGLLSVAVANNTNNTNAYEIFRGTMYGSAVASVICGAVSFVDLYHQYRTSPQTE